MAWAIMENEKQNETIDGSRAKRKPVNSAKLLKILVNTGHTAQLLIKMNSFHSQLKDP